MAYFPSSSLSPPYYGSVSRRAKKDHLCQRAARNMRPRVSSRTVAILLLAAWTPPVLGDAVPAGYIAAPYYPTPYGGWTPDWVDSYAKAEALVRNMTLAEKTNITAGSGLYMGKWDSPFTVVPTPSRLTRYRVSLDTWRQEGETSAFAK